MTRQPPSSPVSRTRAAPQTEADLQTQAADWVIRLDDPDLAPARRAELEREREAWLAAAPAHRHAYADASAAWQALDAAFAAPSAAQRPTTTRAAPSRARRHTRRATLSALGGVLLLAGALSWVWHTRPDYATATGEIRRLALADGSHVTLDSNSAIDVRYDAQTRRVRLRRGRAAFDVAHGDARRFLVHDRDGTVEDIGTAFQIERGDEDSRIVVTQGSVRLHAVDGETVLAAGQAARYGSDRLAWSQSGDLEAATAWQRGRLVFVNTPLGEVLAQLNRYFPGHIFLADRELAQRPVSGSFRLAAPGAALDTICDALALRSTRFAGRWVWLAKK